MTPHQIIEEFKDHISWFDECEIVHIEGQTYLKSRACLMRPVVAHEAIAAIPEVEAHAAVVGSACPAMIIHGELSHYDLDKIWYTLSRKGIVMFFLDAKNKVRANRNLLRLTDGVNLFEEVAKRWDSY